MNKISIVFVCGSLEPGCDGVGDYTRRLAGEVFRQGHEVAILSVNDKHVLKKIEEVQESDGTFIKVLRIPDACTYNEKISISKFFIESKKPDLLSLQCVLFAFEDRGLPFKIGRVFKQLGGDTKWHIMFHELWVGMETSASKKVVFWGWVQKQIISSLIKKIHPAIIHTNTRVYQRQLNKIGIKSKLLPLFSNIPVLASGAKRDNNNISFVIFGSIHSFTDIEQFASEVAELCKRNKIGALLIMLGRCGDKQKYWLDAWTRAGLLVDILGEQPPELVSKVLLTANFGISTTPVELIGKSGTIAAMREHGLPIISIASEWRARGLTTSELPDYVYRYIPGSLDLNDARTCSTLTINKLHQVAKVFTDDLLVVRDKKATCI
ncbi:MAG: hypothetical protein M3040_04335 [Bacteroidota bacterium]|nr:hypothetical protein [Bacteroidota bacterium]